MPLLGEFFPFILLVLSEESFLINYYYYYPCRFFTHPKDGVCLKANLVGFSGLFSLLWPISVMLYVVWIFSIFTPISNCSNLLFQSYGGRSKGTINNCMLHSLFVFFQFSGKVQVFVYLFAFFFFFFVYLFAFLKIFSLVRWNGKIHKTIFFSFFSIFLFFFFCFVN